MATQVEKENGFAVRGDNGGYFAMNGLGDWSLAESVEGAAIFSTIKDAWDVLIGCDVAPDEVELVPISRTIDVTFGEPVAFPDEEEIA